MNILSRNPGRLRVPGWFCFNTILGTIIALFRFRDQAGEFSDVFWISQLVTHAISTVCVLAGYHVFARVRMRGTYGPGTLLGWILPAAELATVAVLGFLYGCDLVFNWNWFGTAGEFLTEVAAPSLLLTPMVTLFAVALEFMVRRPVAQAARTDPVLTIREGENRFLIPFDEILYLTGHGKRTIIHTEARDFEAITLLKDLMGRLPAQNFLRIHKSHAVNLRYVSHFRPQAGGAYELFLLDSDETRLPVGRAFARAFKEHTGRRPARA